VHEGRQPRRHPHEPGKVKYILSTRLASERFEACIHLPPACISKSNIYLGAAILIRDINSKAKSVCERAESEGHYVKKKEKIKAKEREMK